MDGSTTSATPPFYLWKVRFDYRLAFHQGSYECQYVASVDWKSATAVAPGKKKVRGWPKVNKSNCGDPPSSIRGGVILFE
jgi:hypothetical protein